MPLHKTQNPIHNVLLVVGFALSAPWAFSGCAAGGGWHMPPPVVETTSAMAQPWTVTYTASGTLEANNKVDLNTETPGIITHIQVKEGDAVRAGQVLMRFKADKQLAQVQQAAAGISVSQSTLEQQKAGISQIQTLVDSAKVKLKLAQSELKRYEQLYQGDFVSQLELEQKRTAFETASADYQSSLHQLNSAHAQYDQAASNLAQSRSSYRYNIALAGETFVRSPFNGIIGSKYVDLGDYVAPTEKLITVVDPSTFRVTFSVPEKYLSNLHPGLPVQGRFEGAGDKTVTGRVSFIDPVVDPNAHTVKVKATIPATVGLRHGLFGDVSLALGQLTDAVVVPEEAIVPQGEKTFVYVVRHEIYQPTVVQDEKKGEKAKTSKQPKEPEKPKSPTHVAHLQEVTIGYRNAGKVQIKTGLKPGDRVIVSGLQKVSDNLEVNPDPSPAASGTKGQ